MTTVPTSWASIPSLASANGEIRVAVAGIRSRGHAHIEGLRRLDGVRVVALCDVDRGVLANRAAEFEKRGESVDTAVDLRELLDRDDIDAVSLATPNHWHSLATIWACQAGKDVYVEKPVSHNIYEGRKMVEAARRYSRIVQAGTQSRSSQGMTEAIEWIQQGNLGKITLARGLCYKPRQSIGKVTEPTVVPTSIDYDLWTGPAPLVPLMRKRLHYDWHWVFDTGNGDLGNQGIHQMDMCRWALGEQTLARRVMSFGGRFGYDDDGNTPNTMVTVLDYDSAPLVFEVRGLPRDAEARKKNWGGSMDRYLGSSIGAVIHCEGGALVLPNYSSARALDREGQEIAKWAGARNHFQNFIDAVRTRRRADLNADILEGHLSSALCHQGNISYQIAKQVPGLRARDRISWPADGLVNYDRFIGHLERNEIPLESTDVALGPVLDFDPATERFIDNDQANQLVSRDYREGFTLPDEA